MAGRTPPSSNRLLGVLARSTSTGQFIPEIDGLRCLAILSVIAFHLAGFVDGKAPHPYVDVNSDWLYRLARTGHIGVQLFFIISGFVVAMPFAKRFLTGGAPVNLRRYFLRRLTRIEPPYVIALVFWLIAFGVSGLGDSSWRVMLHHFPASLFYMHNYVYGTYSAVLPPAWSLEIEVQFYVLAPLLVWVFAIRPASVRRVILLVVAMALAFAQRWLRQPLEINGLNVAQEGQWFLLGLLLVDLYLSPWWRTSARSLVLWDLLATICFAAVAGILIHYPGSYLLPPPLLLLACIGALRGRWWRSLLANPWIYTFGGMCYTIYLYHGFFKALPGHYTVRMQIGNRFWLNFLIQSAILFPIIAVGSAIMYVFTEKPFMRWRPKRLRS